MGSEKQLSIQRPPETLSSAQWVPGIQTPGWDVTRCFPPGQVPVPCLPPAFCHCTQQSPALLNKQPIWLLELAPKSAHLEPVSEPKHPVAEPVRKSQKCSPLLLCLSPKPTQYPLPASENAWLKLLSEPQNQPHEPAFKPWKRRPGLHFQAPNQLILSAFWPLCSACVQYQGMQETWSPHRAPHTIWGCLALSLCRAARAGREGAELHC